MAAAAARLRALDRRLRGHVVRGRRGRDHAAAADLLDGEERRLARRSTRSRRCCSLATALLLLGGVPARAGALGCARPPLPAALGLARPRRALRAGRRARRRRRPGAEPLHLVELHRPGDAREVRGAPRREGATSTSTTRTRRCSPSCRPATPATTSSARPTTRSRCCVAQNLLRPLDHSALPHLANIDPSFLDRPYDPGNVHSVPYFWGTTGIAYDRTSAWPSRRRLVGGALGPALPRAAS